MSWFDEFDYGQTLGIGLDNHQLAHLVGAIFLGLFALSALRHAKKAGGFYPAIWLAVALGLLAGTLIVVARGFPEELPDFLKSWTDPDRIARLVAVLALFGLSAVLISAYWVRGGLAKFWFRAVGLASGGLAAWLAVGWFGEEIPDEARPWTADRVIIHAVVVLGLLALAFAFWVRGNSSSAHIRWANRTLVPIALAMAIVLASRWFVAPSWADFPRTDVERVTTILATIASATCLLIAGGAFFLREHPPVKKASAKISLPEPKLVPSPSKSPSARLPVAMLIDERGQPVLPKGTGHAGP